MDIQPGFTLDEIVKELSLSSGIMSRTSVGRASQRRPGHSHQHSHHGHQHGCSGALAQSKRKVAPAPPQVPVPVPAPPSSAGAMGSATTSVSWPAGSIPRRVKKLSWDDEDENKVSFAGYERLLYYVFIWRYTESINSNYKKKQCVYRPHRTNVAVR